MLDELPDLSGRLAVVTGATGVLGQEIVARLHEAGARLRLIGRDGDRLKQAAARLSGDVEIRSLDRGGVEPAAARAALGDVDILVNKAAIQGPIGPAWENGWDAWREAIEIDLLSPVLLARVAAAGMRKRSWGRIISVSGGGATGARPNFTSYAVAKTGLVRFSEILAAELTESGVTVNTIAPGAFQSSLTGEVMAAAEGSGASELRVAQGLTADVTRETVRLAASLCLFLASDASAGITGRLIAARWDDWQALPTHAAALAATDLFTLRRITPQDRGINWGSK